jgi:hypothetical protein
MIDQLENLLAALKSDGEYEVMAFPVCRVPVPYEFGPALVHVEHRGCPWGFCTSETCRHNSHDPLAEGTTVFIRCRKVEEERERTTYELPDGRLFWYVNRPKGHYIPHREITFDNPDE